VSANRDRLLAELELRLQSIARPDPNPDDLEFWESVDKGEDVEQIELEGAAAVLAHPDEECDGTRSWSFWAGDPAKAGAPGVYMFWAYARKAKDATCTRVALYIGKAVNMRKRVRQHMRGSGSAWTDRFWDDVDEDRLEPCIFVSFFPSNSKAALEAQMISQHRPIYNRQAP
jgi:hypothetical protein